jgi:membrane protein implicated in regulation of membrane protease activity
MNEFGKILFVVGLVLAGAGLMLWLGFGRGWIGRLPGDIHYTKGNFSVYVPIVTCLILSLLLTLLMWIFRR